MAETITAKTTKEAAPKKLTIAEILAQRKAFEEQIAAQLAEERPAALDAVKEQIATFTFTAEELGFASLEVSPKPNSKPNKFHGFRHKPLRRAFVPFRKGSLRQ